MRRAIKGFNHGLPWCVKYMALGPPVATKPSGFAVGFCGDRSPSCHVFHTPRPSMIKTYNLTLNNDDKRKPPCIGGMELVSLSCNRVFISAESVGRGWCKIVIATKWYQFHTTDKCGFLFMPWITDVYTFVQYTKLVNEIGTAVAKVITFSIMTT